MIYARNEREVQGRLQRLVPERERGSAGSKHLVGAKALPFLGIFLWVTEDIRGNEIRGTDPEMH